MFTRSLLAASCAATLFAGNAYAVSPYNTTYGLQWTYLNGGINDERNGWLEASPDGTAWFSSGWSSYTGANFSLFGDQGNGGQWDSGYGQINGRGSILQGKSLPNLTGHQAENQSYTRQHMSMQGTSLVLGWSSNGNQDPDANGIQGAWWGPTSDGVGRETFENKGGPMTVKIGPDGAGPGTEGTLSLKTNPTLLTTNLRSESLAVSQIDNTIWFVGGYQGAGNDVITPGDGTVGGTAGYSPFIGRQSAAGVVTGPTKQSNADGSTVFVSVDVNDVSNRVMAVGTNPGTAGVGATWDADGDGIADQTAPGTKTDFTMAVLGIYNATTMAVTGTVAWNSDYGGDVASNVAATPDGGFVVTGRTKGSMTGYTNPGSGVDDDIYVAKYDSAGALLWDWQSEAAGDDEGVSVSVDDDGNVYLGSRSGVVRAGANNTNQPVISGDVGLTKFDAAGNVVWSKTLDQGGTLDDIFSAGAANKTRVYVASESNPVLGPTWTNINTYNPGTGDDRELLLQKLVPGDFNTDGMVDGTDVAIVAGLIGAPQNGVDTYDFNEDGNSTQVDLSFFLYKVLDRAPDLDADNDVDDADFGIAFAAFSGPNTATTNPYADFDADGDVDDADFGIAFAGFTGPGGVIIPEPTSLALLGLGGLMIARRRRA